MQKKIFGDKKHVADIALIALLVIVVLSVFAFTWFSAEPGARVRVNVEGEPVREYSLDVDGEYSLNGGTNKLKIENGEAWMIEADCPTTGDTKCTHQGKISKTGQKITCLPNRLVVNIVGGEVEGEVDLIS